MDRKAMLEVPCEWCDEVVRLDLGVKLTNYQPAGAPSRSTMVSARALVQHHYCAGPTPGEVVLKATM